MPAEIINTAVGPAEVEVLGSGFPVLIIHGSPGGVDGAIAMCRFLPQDTFKSICVSRPGYLRTPLRPGNSPIDYEADLLAGLLDALDVQRVGVLSWSGGGGAAYRLAVLHPNRVSTIIAIAALSKPWIAPKATLAERLMFGTSVGNRLIGYLSRKVPRHIVEGALENEGSLRGEDLRLLVDQVMANPDQCGMIIEMAPTINTGGKRAAGWQNDVANFARIDSLELERVQCPVLLIHGDADTDAVPEYSRFAHAHLRSSILIEMKQGTHLSFYAHPEAPEIQEKARRWLAEHSMGYRC